MGCPRSTPELQADLAKGQEHPHLDENPDRDQIVERLGWTPKQRLDYLVDMVAFEERAHRARRIG
jgi:hypothetical protein